MLLRYSVYRASRVRKFCPVNEVGIDMDCYDLSSRHFGLYEHTGSISRPVGYIRLVTETEGTFRNELFELSKTIPSIYEKVNRIPTEPFPLMAYFPDAALIKKHHMAVKSQGETLVEASRLSLDPSVRGRHISTYFVASVFASSLAHDYGRSVMTCHVDHESFYRQFGFSRLEGTQDRSMSHLDYHAVCLSCSIVGIPSPMKEKVQSMADMYSRFGRICYDPSNPKNHYAPLGSYLKSRSVFTAISA